MRELSRSSKSAPDIFYKGRMAKAMVKEIQDDGGIIEESDFRAYKALIYEARRVDINDQYILYSVDPPGCGNLLGFGLRLFDQLYRRLVLNTTVRSNRQRPSDLHQSVAFYQTITEIFKFLYAIRTQLQDKKDERMRQLLGKMDTTTYLNHLAELVNLNYTEKPLQYLKMVLDKSWNGTQSQDHGTAHVNVMDKNGNAASVTSSVNL